MCVFLASVTANNWVMHKLDVKTAFVNGTIEETLYMRKPKDWPLAKPGQVCNLHNTLYGLKQAPTAWHQKIKTQLFSVGFSMSNADPALFFAHNNHRVYLLISMDDCSIASAHLEGVVWSENSISDKFAITLLGELVDFLGLR